MHGGGALVRRRDERGGGVERGFGSFPVHSVFLLPSCDMKYFQYASSRAKYTHVVSRPSLAAPGMMRRMLFARFFLLFCSTPPRRRLLSHHAVRSWVGIWSSLLRTTFPMKVSYNETLNKSRHYVLDILLGLFCDNCETNK